MALPPQRDLEPSVPVPDDLSARHFLLVVCVAFRPGGSTLWIVLWIPMQWPPLAWAPQILSSLLPLSLVLSPSALQLERHLRDKFTCHCLCLSLATHPTVIFQLVIMTDCTHCGPTPPPFWSAPRVCPPPCPLCLLQFPVNHYRHSLAHTFFLSFFCFI